MAEKTKTGSGPVFACEITPTSVIAARANVARSEIEALHSRTLPEGALVPALATENIVQREAVREAMAAVLEAVGAQSRDVVAIVPDAACRIALLDFDALPTRTEEANAVVRFRLKKALPFDADKAVLSYHVFRTPPTVKVVAAVMLGSVLSEYESLFRELGCNPGVVLPSTVSALGLVDASSPTLALKVDPLTSSVAIVDADQLLLYRILEHGGKHTLTAEQLAEDIYPSIVYFQDNYNLSVQRLVVAGLPTFPQLAPALRQQTGLLVEEVAPTGLPTGATNKSELSGVAGALLG